MSEPLISRVKAEVARIRYSDEGQDPLLNASEELEALKSATAEATSEILGIAEDVLAGIERLRAEALPEGAADELVGMEAKVMRLFEACGFQDLTGQRSSKVARVLEGLDGRVGSILDMLDHVEVPDEVALAAALEIPAQATEAALLSGPQAAGMGLDQKDVDALFG
jgi:chemotaxis protein CheZ